MNMKNYTLKTKEELETYFSSDADMLDLIRNYKVSKVEVTIDTDGEYASWQIINDCNDGTIIGDDYLGTLQAMLEIVKLRFTNELDEMAVDKAEGNLSRLINLRQLNSDKELAMLDNFFDDKDLRIKYGAWNEEDNEPNFDITISDIEMKLGASDMIRLIDVYESQLDIEKGNY